MMKNRTRILALALLSGCLCSGLIGCSGEPSNQGDNPIDGGELSLNYLTARTFSPDRTVEAVSDQFRTAYADLALKLLTSCRADQGSDTLISPLSVMTALAMTANGAEGDTLAQMEALLGGEMDIEAINQQIFNFYVSLSSTESASFKAANSIWLTTRSHFTVNPDFIGKMENTYNADVIGIDFANSPYAADSINYWCRQKTDGMIPSIVTPGDFNAQTVMALLNALTFDAEWERPYLNEECMDGIFHGTAGDTDVTMLHYVQYKDYIEGERETGFIRYYKGEKYAFVALLPMEEGDISDYLSTLSGSYLLNLIKNTSGGTIVTTLPAFKQETSLDLIGTLKELGVADAFDPGKASFSGLGSADGGIRIDQVIHKTFIEVNQIGTRAGSVTLDREAGATPDIKIVTLDRPFVYAIIDTATSLPIFVGSCENVA